MTRRTLLRSATLTFWADPTPHGLRLGSVLFGLLAAGFLVGTVREVMRVKAETGAGETPDSPRTEA